MATLPIHIAIVDDELDITRLLGGCLQAHGYRVSELNTGTALMKLIAADPPALVLLELLGRLYCLICTEGLEPSASAGLAHWAGVPVLIDLTVASHPVRIRSIRSIRPKVGPAQLFSIE